MKNSVHGFIGRKGFVHASYTLDMWLIIPTLIVRIGRGKDLVLVLELDWLCGSVYIGRHFKWHFKKHNIINVTVPENRK